MLYYVHICLIYINIYICWQVESPAQFIVSPGSGQFRSSTSQPYGGQKQFTGFPEPLPYGNKQLSTQFGTPDSTYPSKYNTIGSQTLLSEPNVVGSQTLPSDFNAAGSQTLPYDFNTAGQQTLPSDFNVADNQTLLPVLNTAGTQTLPSEYDIARSENLTNEQKVPGSTEIPSSIPSCNDSNLPFGSGVHKASVPIVKDQNFSHTGPVPYRPGTMLSQDGNLRIKPTSQSEQHPYMPGKESAIHRFQSGESEPVNQMAKQEAGNITPGNKGSMGDFGDEKLKQGGPVSLPHLSAMTPATFVAEAVQAPYGAQLDTVRGKYEMK